MAIALPTTVGMPLSLPRLDPSIPEAIEPLASRRLQARLARGLLDGGAIDAAAVKAGRRSMLKVCEAALQAWLHQHLGELHCLDLSFVLVLRSETETERSIGYAEPELTPEAEIRWFATCGLWPIGHALQALENVHKGLGATVLTAFDENSDVMPFFSPRDALEVCQEFYWYGLDDESEALENCETDEERRDLAEEMITRAKLDAAFPKWATEFPSKRPNLKVQQLRRLKRGALAPREREVIDNVLALKAARARLLAARSTADFDAQEDGWFTGHAALLAWHEDDLSTRLYDDYCNYASESETRDTIGLHPFDLDNSASLQQWGSAMKHHFECIRLLDRLIALLSDGDWPQADNS